MPTKPNRAGNQQNYVPAGNGDASGEYGDNATGSNIHFTNFKKPDDNSLKEKPSSNKTVNGGNDDFRVTIEEKPKNAYSGFENYMSANYSEGDEFASSIKKSFEVGTDDAKGLIDYLVINGANIEQTTGTSYYMSGLVTVALSPKSVKEGKFSAKDVGETFYHEFWHCADDRFANKLLTEQDKQRIKDSSKGYEYLVYKNNLSTCKVLSNGMTLLETIKQECRSMSKKDVWSQIKNEYEEETRKQIGKKYPDFDKYEKEINEIKRKLEEEARQKFPYRWDESGGNSSVFDNRNAYVEKSMESLGLLDKLNYVKDAYRYKSEAESEVKKSFMSLSDMYGIHKKVSYGFCGGHTGNYGTKMKGAIAFEFIAEFGSAMSRTSEHAIKEMNLFKKYMPNSSAACEELCKIILKAQKGE